MTPEEVQAMYECERDDLRIVRNHSGTFHGEIELRWEVGDRESYEFGPTLSEALANYRKAKAAEPDDRYDDRDDEDAAESSESDDRRKADKEDEAFKEDYRADR